MVRYRSSEGPVQGNQEPVQSGEEGMVLGGSRGHGTEGVKRAHHMKVRGGQKW